MVRTKMTSEAADKKVKELLEEANKKAAAKGMHPWVRMSKAKADLVRADAEKLKATMVDLGFSTDDHQVRSLQKQ